MSKRWSLVGLTTRDGRHYGGVFEGRPAAARRTVAQLLKVGRQVDGAELRLTTASGREVRVPFATLTDELVVAPHDGPTPV